MVVLVELVKHIRRLHRELLQGGTDPELAKAVSTYLSMAACRLVNSFTKLCRWSPHGQQALQAVGDQLTLKMVYDYAEINPLAQTSGCLSHAIRNEVYCINRLASMGHGCTVVRGNAEHLPWPDETFDAVVTDPPYYGTIFYSDLSSLFYTWHRRIIGDLYPEHFALPVPPKRREAVAQRSEHGGNADKAEGHYREVMGRAFAEARRVLKPGAPLVCVYAHKTSEGWASLIKSLISANLTVTEAWPMQTEARARMNSIGKAALSDSIFFVARRRDTENTGAYESDVLPELEKIAAERVSTLWANGNGIGGADLLMAAVGAGLRPFSQFGRVQLANGDEVTAERYIKQVQAVVMDAMLSHVFGLSQSGVTAVDRVTRFYVLWRFAYGESIVDAGDAIVFCCAQGVSMDGPGGIAGPLPRLVEKVKSAYRLRAFAERGANDGLGLGRGDGAAAPVVDVLHRVLWLLENRPRELPGFLKRSQANLEQLRAIAEALGRSARKQVDSWGTMPPELSVLNKLTSNWRSVVERESAADDDDMITGQRTLSLSGNRRRRNRI